MWLQRVKQAKTKSNETCFFFTLDQGNIYSLEGNVIYDNSINSALNKVHLILKNQYAEFIDSTNTDATGYYKFMNLNNGNFTITAIINKTAGGITL